MRVIITFITIGIFSLGCTKTDKSSGHPSQETTFVIQVGNLPFTATNFDSKALNDEFLNILGKNGQIIFLSLDESSQKRIDSTHMNSNLGDLEIYALPLFEGPPCTFQSELPVVRVDCHFRGIKPTIIDNQNNVWDEERFLQVTNNKDENTAKVKSAMIGIMSDFFTWYRSAFPSDKIVFYVRKSEAG